MTKHQIPPLHFKICQRNPYIGRNIQTMSKTIRPTSNPNYIYIDIIL